MPLRPASRPGQAETWTRARPCDVRDAVPQVARGACHDVELLLRYGWMGSQIGEEGVLHRRESRWSGCSGSVVLDFNTRHLSEETKQLIFLHADAEACRRREVVHNATLHSSRRSFGIVEVLFFFFEVELRLSNNARCRAGRWQAAGIRQVPLQPLWSLVEKFCRSPTEISSKAHSFFLLPVSHSLPPCTLLFPSAS